MEETKIKGLKITYTKNLLTIQKSYQISDIDKMKVILNEALEKSEIYSTQRNLKSLLREWISHNTLYKLHLFRKHTSNCSFEKEIKKYISFVYFFLSLPSRIKYKIKKFYYFLKTKRKEKQYKKYLKKHLKYIKKAYKKLIHNPNIYLLVDKEILNKLYQRVLNHDKSKFSSEEFDYYRKYYFPINNNEKEENLKDYEKALEHHYQNNSHHWQHRQEKKTFNIYNDEEILDVLENLLDWVAVGYDFKNTAKEYYDKNKDKIILCKEEKIYLEHILYDIFNEEGDLKWKKKKKK